MNCENDFCIYEQDGKCILNDITLDFGGHCSECIYPNIPKDILEKFRKIIL